MAASRSRNNARRWALIGVIALVVVMATLAAAWRWTPLHEIAEPGAMAHWLRSLGRTPWMPPLVAVLYIAASLVMFPNTVLCLAVIMALGPVLGTAYAYGGSLAAALAGYVLGRTGSKRVKKLQIRSLDRVSAELRDGGFMRVLALRLLPLAPFSAVNLMSGASRVHVLPYLAATIVGISPYILAFAAFGRQARRLITNPNPMDAAVTGMIVAVAAVAMWHARSLAAARAK